MVVAIAVVFICFYLLFKNSIVSHDATAPPEPGNAPSALQTSSMPGDQADGDRPPPQHGTVDQPPPYSLVREAAVSRSLQSKAKVISTIMVYV